MGSDMDCCRKALMASQTPEVAAARLCCVVNCSTDGTTNPTSNSNLAPQSQFVVSTHPATGSAVLNSRLPLRFIALAHSPPGYSEPTYIRHLALLI